jgi:YbbR domain-containing protein
MKFKRFHIVFATTLFAALLWFSVNMSEQHQVEVSAQLVIEGLPAGKAIASPLPRTVKLTFNEFGWRLAKSLWGSNVRWVVDLSAMPTPRALTLRDFSAQLGWRLGIQPVSMNPESLHITLDVLDVKIVALSPNYSLTFREGYGQVGEAAISPESVTVTGARTVLATIDRWQTTYRAFEQVRQSIDTSVFIADTTNSLTFVPAEAKLHIGVQQFAEKAFTGIRVDLFSVPQNREVILSSSKIDIVVRGGIDQLSGISQSHFRAAIDYRTILADTSGTIQPDINSPNGVVIVKRTPERLQYIVRKKY